MRQCAEDACIALGFINPGDVATMMARMKKALKGLARCWTLYNLSCTHSPSRLTEREQQRGCVSCQLVANRGTTAPRGLTEPVSQSRHALHALEGHALHTSCQALKLFKQPAGLVPGW